MTAQNGAITPFKDFARDEKIVERFAEMLGERNARAYVNSVILAVANSPTLQKCSSVSLISAALQAAALRLSCDPQMKQAYLVPFKGKAVLIVGYKGLYDLAVRTGRYRYIHVHPLHGEQSVSFDPFTGKPELVGHGSAMDPINGWMASFQMMDGYSKTVAMSKAEIHAHAEQYSAGYNRSDSAWKTNEESMERKTVLRQLLTKWGYMDPGDAALLSETGEDAEFIEVEDLEPAPALVEVEPQEPEQIIEQLGF